MRIAISGADGLLGRHARAYLRTLAGTELVLLRRGDLEDAGTLASRLRGCVALWHLAGVNRATDRELEEGNIDLARLVDQAIALTGEPIAVLYASSTQAANDTPYGRGKRIAGEVLRAGAEERGGTAIELVLPHVFGEGGRPRYNSAVATFVDLLLTGADPQLNPEGRVELMHAGRVAERFYREQQTIGSRIVRPEGTPLSVPDLWSRLADLAGRYRAGVIPLLADPLDRYLFNTYRYAAFPAGLTHSSPVHADQRGRLHEVIRHSGQGQVFVSTTRPGMVRGRHWHRFKVERFCVISGDAVVRFRQVLDSAVTEVRLRDEGPQIVDIPTLHTHEVENPGSADLMMAFWADEHFDPAAADTYPEPVLQP